jgi:hypothetical protein
MELARVECKELDQLAKEDPAAYDSQSNGGTEIGVRMIRGLFRTLKLCLEARIDKYIPIDHPIIAWMMQHVCLLLNCMIKGDDGITAWHRVRGRPFHQQLLGFGECILYRYPSKGPHHQPDGNMGALGAEGVFLGYNRMSNTYIVANDDGFVATRSVTRRPEAERWRADALAKISATPGKERDQARASRQKFDAPATTQGPTAEEAKPTASRRLRINMSDLKKYDHFDENCAQCRYIRQYGKARDGGTHTHACRKMLTEKMQQTDEGKARLAAHEERIDQNIAEQIEHQDRVRAAAQPAPAAECPRPARGFLERAPDGEPAARRPPECARVRPLQSEEAKVRDAPAVAAELPTARDTPEPAEAPWQDVHGGEAAPVTPRGTPQVTETAPGASSTTGTQVEDAEMGGGNGGDGGYDVEMDFVGSIEAGTELGSLEPDVDDFVSDLLLQQLGALSRSYKREARKAAKAIVSEIYSPPRVTSMLRRSRTRYVAPGFALDLTVTDPEDGKPWDFSTLEKRQKARRLIREQKPYMLIGSPECRQFSTWQALNSARCGGSGAAIRKAKEEATLHLNFVAELYNEQMDGDRYFLHEHPMWATSWSVPSIENVLRRQSVQRVQGDQCQYGAEIQRGKHKGQPILKPTGFMTNSPAVARALSLRCNGTHGECSRPQGGQHQLCSGIHAREAARYPRGLCRAILRGVRDQLKEDNVLKAGCFGVQAADEDADVERELRGPTQGYSGRFRDDLTGQILRDDLVRAARAAELAYFHSKSVWVKVPKQQARARGGRAPISVRWVDVNKGDDLTPKYRSRLVARQMKAMDSSRTSYFAPAPPLEALRTVISLAMTRVGDHRPDWNPESAERTQLSLVDVKRAYFNAKIDPREPETYVQLPEEEPGHEDMCAQLLRHMYGTRPAADGWQEEYSTLLVSLGFRQGDACPNVFYHPQRQIATSVHGDDFTSSGPKPSLDWLEAAVGEKYELDIGPRLGPASSDQKEGRVLNRVIRWMDDRIEYEADPRQIERLVAECGLEGAKSTATPGVRATFKKLEEDAELPAHLNTAFRGAAARGNYLSADRLDVQFACKEVCRWMSRPTSHAWEALKRVCRFLNGAPRLVYEFRQQSVSHVDVYTDTDWAGCPKTRKSTSGGCVMLGHHAVKHWSSTQQSISLSSGEAEFAGVIRGAGQGLGYQALLKDLGVVVPLRVWTDSSAAIGICTRQGLGKLRHLDTHTLWIQQAVRTRRVDLRKVEGEQNPADLLTKHSISRQRLESLVALFGCRYLGGRAESAPLMRKGRSDRMTMAKAAQELAEVRDEEEAGPDGQADGETSPIMPHLTHSPTDLDRLYPSLEAPSDEGLDDMVEPSADGVYQRGLAIAAEIQAQTAVQGRRRRPEAGTGGEDGQHRENSSGAQQAAAAAAAPAAAAEAGTNPQRRSWRTLCSSQGPRRSDKTS